MARAPEMYRRGHAVASLEEAAEGPSIWQVGTGWVGVRKRSRRGVTPEVFFYLKYKILHSDAFFGSENRHCECFLSKSKASLDTLNMTCIAAFSGRATSTALQPQKSTWNQQDSDRENCGPQ